uniref:Uncharacterized protein n=1 Tax=Elaeophora elaphi TaxID=1147741 RepID=A0A0R3S6R0_9BILA
MYHPHSSKSFFKAFTDESVQYGLMHLHDVHAHASACMRAYDVLFGGVSERAYRERKKRKKETVVDLQWLSNVSTSKKDGGRSEQVVRGEKRRSRLDEPQAAACCPDRYSQPDDVHLYEQLHSTTTPVSYQHGLQLRQPHTKEISSIGSKEEKVTTGEIKRDGCSPTVTCNKQKLEKLSQRQRNSIFAIARAKLSSFVNRLSASSGAGCAATRILANTSNITTARNDLSSANSFPLQSNSHQNTIQTDPHSVATTTLSAATPALLLSSSSSSVQANTSLPTSTVLPNSVESCYNTDGVQNELQFVKSPVTTTLFYQCNASSNSHNGGEHLHHLQKQKAATSSASCSHFQQTNYPVSVHLTDGENGHFGMVW